MQVTKETLFPSTKREKGHRCRHPHVNAKVAHLGFIPESPRSGPAPSKQARHIAIVVAVDQGNGFINVVGMQIAELRNLPVTLTSLEGESVEERMARRVSRWTPMTLTEAA